MELKLTQPRQVPFFRQQVQRKCTVLRPTRRRDRLNSEMLNFNKVQFLEMVTKTFMFYLIGIQFVMLKFHPEYTIYQLASFQVSIAFGISQC